MTCNEIENRLPAYLDDLLSPEEERSIEGHIAACPRCSQAFTDLKRAEELVRGLGEVEPPPFFEQRIMSRVREEVRQKQGILRRLFYPLHIKIPIQALATILITVLAFYVYHTSEPEMQQFAPLPIPLTGLGRGKVTAETPKALIAPSAVIPAKRAPSGDFPDKEQQRLAAPLFENGGKADKIAELPAPIREEHPSAVKPEVQVGAMREAVREKEIPPEQKRNEKGIDTRAAVEESGKITSPPVPPTLTATAAIRRSAIDLTIQVGDRSAAIRKIEAHLGQFNARIIEKQQRGETEVLKAEIAAQKISAFLVLLEAIGRVTLEKSPSAIPDTGAVTISMKIVAHP